jgi:hypothetical protein
VLTTRELNRALLARQLLLRRANLSVPKAIERLGALQAQWPPSPYVALWSRLDDFRREQLQRAVEMRRVVKSTLMRETLHLVTATDYVAYAGLFLSARVARLERLLAKTVGGPDLEHLGRELVRHASQSPRSRPELLALLELPRLDLTDRRPWLFWHALSAKAGLVHTPAGSVWRKRTGGSKFVPARTWLGADGAEDDAARVHLVHRYLAAFGPATRADAAQWTGLPVAALEPALSDPALRRFRDELGRELLDVPRAPIPPAETEAPPRFLPPFEGSILAHADRSRILPDAYRKAVIRGGDVRPSFLVDGFVAGIWDYDGDEVALEPFEQLGRGVRRALEAEARGLARFSS